MSKKLSNLEIVDFCEQMAMIVNAGISPYEGVDIMLEDAKDYESKHILTVMKEKLGEGSSFYEAISETKVFPVYASHMIKIGEESGRLDDVLKALVNYYEREEGIMKAIKNAVTFPLIMVVVMIVVIVALLVKVLPVFEDVFVMLGTQMTGISKSLMNIGGVFSRYAVVFIIIIAAIVFLILFFSKSEKGKKFFREKIGSHGPLKRMYERISAGRFASGMALTLKSGLDVNESVKMVNEMVEMPLMKKRVENCLKLMEEGESFADSLSKSNVFTKVYAKMVVIGFKTGSIDNIMDKIAQNYEQETDDSINKAITILEPTLVAVFAVIVGLILLSVMLPLLSIMTGIM